MKRCTKCLLLKAEYEFYRHSQPRNGRRSDCKKCYCEIRHKHRARNRERVREVERRYKKRPEVMERLNDKRRVKSALRRRAMELSIGTDQRTEA